MPNLSIYTNIGASNHSQQAREDNDFYATDPIAGKLLLEVLPELNNIWECACGKGHLAKVFSNADKLNKATDLINRGSALIVGKAKEQAVQVKPIVSPINKPRISCFMCKSPFHKLGKQMTNF